MADCRTCGAWCISEYHKCPPQWQVLNRDYHGDDWGDSLTIYAHDAEEAAEKAAETIDDNGGDGPSEQTLVVRQLGETAETIFDVKFDYSVDYSAHARSAVSAKENQT